MRQESRQEASRGFQKASSQRLQELQEAIQHNLTHKREGLEASGQNCFKSIVFYSFLPSSMGYHGNSNGNTFRGGCRLHCTQNIQHFKMLASYKILHPQHTAQTREFSQNFAYSKIQRNFGFHDQKIKCWGSSETRFDQVSDQSELSSGGKRTFKIRETNAKF